MHQHVMLLQLAVILGLVHILRQYRPIGMVGTPSISMGLSLVLGSAVPIFAPTLHHNLFPEPPEWLGFFSTIVVLALGAYAGKEIDLKLIMSSGKKAWALMNISTIGPMLAALPIAILLVSVPNDFIVSGANKGAVILGICGIVALKALPVMISYLKSARLENTPMGRLCLAAASYDDMLFYVVILPIISGLSVNGGFFGVIEALVMTGAFIALMFLVRFGLKILPTSLQSTAALASLLVGAYVGESYLHLHVVLCGLLWGKILPEEITDQTLHPIEGFVQIWGVPLFFAALGLKVQFDIMKIDVWVMASLLFAVNYIAHTFASKRAAVSLYGISPTAAKAFTGLNRTKGLADVIFGTILFGLNLITASMLGAIMIFAIAATAHGLYQTSKAAEEDPQAMAQGKPQQVESMQEMMIPELA